jgi:prepilin-type processing-associated H-X9-DG protein
VPGDVVQFRCFLVDRDRTLQGGTYILLRKPRPDALGATITASKQLGEMAPDLAYASDYPIIFVGPGAYGWMWAPTSSMVFRRGALEPVLAFPFKTRIGPFKIRIGPFKIRIGPFKTRIGPFKTRIGTDYLAATCAHLAAGSLLLSECPGLNRLHGTNASANVSYAGGHVQQSPAYRTYEMPLGADVLDYVLANAKRLGVANGKDFVPGFLAQHVSRFGSMGNDPRVMPFLDCRSCLRWLASASSGRCGGCSARPEDRQVD